MYFTSMSRDKSGYILLSHQYYGITKDSQYIAVGYDMILNILFGIRTHKGHTMPHPYIPASDGAGEPLGGFSKFFEENISLDIDSAMYHSN